MESSARARGDDADMTLLAEDNTQSAVPPARLAARFYRNSARRRSSAHSSRRSSLSSIHSHSSNVSCHGGPRSTHIAQHLRRASIIESRKARLAERAAHAEQVRLRAAAARAAPRGSNSEEKALAAQAAREKLLAEIAARCEEEVRRAKKIAEETKEKKAAEEARLREELAEKFADAARRKSVYQASLRRPRTTSLAAVEEKKVSPVSLQRMGKTVAAKIIQRAWRAHAIRKMMLDFQNLGLNLSDLNAASFEDVTKLIAEQETFQVTLKVLQHLGILALTGEQMSDRETIRVFLSAYLILAHPMQALSYGGSQPLEQELMTKAGALIQPFEVYVESCTHRGLNGKMLKLQQDDVSFAYNDYISAFQAWKSRDLSDLIDVMIGSFVNLDLIIQSTKDSKDGYVAEDYLQAVRQEQIKLLARLKKLAGPEKALNKVRVAVKKARRQRTLEKKEQSEEHVPRAATPTDQRMDTQTPLTPPPTPRLSSTRTDAAPASLITRLGQTMTVLPPNREIAHEMQINGTFEVQQQPWTDARKQFMDSLRTSMRESMQTGGHQAAASWTHAMAVLIRDKLMNLVSQRHPLYDRVDGFLDPKLIDQQCRNGMFSYDSFFDTIATLIAQICSPGRDEVVQVFAKEKTSNTIDRLFSLINILDLMTLDHINFQFRLASKQVIEHGHEHEHSMFESDLRNGVHSLDRTKTWWRTAKAGLSAGNPTGNAIYTRGLTDLVLQNSHFSYMQLPETLHIDYIRLLKLRAKAMQIVTLSSILLTTKLRLQRNREALWTSDRDRLLAVDLLTVDASRIVSMIESSHRMPESTKEGLLNFVGRVLPPAVAAARNLANAETDRQQSIQNQRPYDPTSPSAEHTSHRDAFNEQIASFLLKSLREHIFSRLSATSAAEKARVTGSAAELLARIGMPEWSGEVSAMLDVMERVKNVDLRAHEYWYDRIAYEISNET